jgi:hypothetical protein
MGSGLSTEKVRCLYLPAQSGKTRKSEEIITAVKNHEKITHRESIDIWISANNKLLVYQTTSRLKKDLGLSTDFSDAVIKGKLFSWTSGTAATNIPYKELSDRILDGEIEAILVCSHKLRLQYLANLIKRLSKTKRSFKKDINIWIDEADRSCGLWMNLEEVLESPLVKTVTLVSATFTEVFKCVPSVRVIPYLDTHPKPYRRLKDCLCIKEDFGPFMKDPVSYALAVLDKYPELSEPGQRAFIPGGIWRSTHEEICELLMSRGFAVLILNGMHKEIRLPSILESGDPPQTILLKPYLTVRTPEKVPDEFNLILARLYQRHRLDRFPFAITGFLCVERGVTFQIGPGDDHDGFLFDYAICAPVNNKSEAYQSMARVFGNVGEIPRYKRCKIYSTPKNFANIQDQEETAVHVARIVHDEKLKSVDASILMRAARYDEERIWKLSMNEFETFEEARDFIKDRGARSPNTPHLELNGYYYSSTTGTKRLLDYDDVLEEIRHWSKTSSFDIKAHPERTFHSRLYICYTDTENPDSAVFLVRSIQRVKMVLRRK